MAVKENGPWRAVDWDGLVAVASDDFQNHDAHLTVHGDFLNKAQRLEYAKEIARRLNAFNS